MNRHLIPCVGAAALLLAVCALLSGCASCKPGKPGPLGKYQIDVNLDPSLKDASVAVDIVGVTPLIAPRWDNYSMKQYWQPQDEMREGADKITFTLGNNVMNHSISANDPKWNDWLKRGVTKVVVLADLPGALDEKVGSLDARRQMLSLDKCDWADGTTNLTIDVKRSGLEVRALARQY